MTRVRIRTDRSALWRTLAFVTVAIGLGLVGYFVAQTSPAAPSDLAPSPPPNPTPMAHDTPEEVPPADFLGEQNQRTVDVFYLDPAVGLLRAESRSILETLGTASLAKQAVTLLLSGPESESLQPVFGDGILVEELFVDPNGEVFVGFSPEIQSPAGVHEELLGLSALALTLSRNFPEIVRMRILIGGTEATTLRGHLSVEYPLLTGSEIYDRLVAPEAEPLP